MSTVFKKLQRQISSFAQERDWDQFHTPKNLVMALVVEGSELMELFQWLTPEESSDLTEEQRSACRDELADIFVYLLRIADCLDIDLEEAFEQKMRKNEAKYPADIVRGKHYKYTHYASFTSVREGSGEGKSKGSG